MKEIAQHQVEEAASRAGAAAARSGVTVRRLSELEELQQVIDLFDDVWRSPGASPIGLEHLRALSHAGNYVSGAFDADGLVGGAVGFFGTPLGSSMHSDVAAVRPWARRRSVGFALKLHQRVWALGHGLGRITWTYDPLVARNAHFNLTKLRARLTGYHENFYGEMSDGVNVGQGSDRLLVSWALTSPEVVGACDTANEGPPAVTRSVVSLANAAHTGPPPNAGHTAAAVLDDVDGRPVPTVAAAAVAVVRVAIPDDIESLRRTDPELALAWRLAVRSTLGAELAAGGRVSAFVRGAGYVIERAVGNADPGG